MNHLAALPAACGRTPITGSSGLVALISAVAEGNLCISWDLHQSGWTRALLKPAEAACDDRLPQIRSEGGAVKTFFVREAQKSEKWLRTVLASYSAGATQALVGRASWSKPLSSRST